VQIKHVRNGILVKGNSKIFILIHKRGSMTDYSQFKCSISENASHFCLGYCLLVTKLINHICKQININLAYL